jgi:uncharacterized membrane protein YphA (DoxX/SURF4 family)
MMAITQFDLSSALRRTEPHRHVLVARLIAGLPLLAFGLAHVFVPEASMLALVEEMGAPAAGVVAPLAVAVEIVAAALLLAGALARLGAVAAIGVMAGAVYAHLVIDVWPNGAENEPPLALPLAVIVASAYVLWRGAGRWSVDRALTR